MFVPGTYHTGLEWDGHSAWLVDGEAELIYELDGSGNTRNFYLPPGTFPRDIAWDGSDLWIADADNDRIYKLRGPIMGPEPRASFTVTPTSGFLETLFLVDASSSQDQVTPLADLEVRWDWENDGAYDTEYSKVKTANHQYASPGTKTIRLEVKDTDGYTGTTTRSVSVSARAPQAFSLISPRSGDTVRTYLPSFKWRTARDADPGDTVRYFVQYSKSSYFSIFDTLAAGTDTPAAVRDSLQQLQRYYWRVEAVDRWGAKTLSSQSWNFLVADLTPPSFTIGLLQNPIITEDLDLYAIPNETLDQRGVQCTANGIPVPMSELDAARRIYVGDYQLSGERKTGGHHERQRCDMGK
ncbi:MAG: PKD domain-containing protein [bacterium]|nr:PKD domain-containing protein [bacterium]